jgi:hypothetical protein
MTIFQVKCLTILRDQGPLRAGQFAERIWPNAPGWHRHMKCGQHGSAAGGGMRIAGGQLLGKLRKAGWVDYIPDFAGRGCRYSLSSVGRLELTRAISEITK